MDKLLDMDKLLARFWSYGGIDKARTELWWRSAEGAAHTDVFKQLVAVDRDPNRRADRYQNGARL